MKSRVFAAACHTAVSHCQLWWRAVCVDAQHKVTFHTHLHQESIAVLSSVGWQTSCTFEIVSLLSLADLKKQHWRAGQPHTAEDKVEGGLLWPICQKHQRQSNVGIVAFKCSNDELNESMSKMHCAKSFAFSCCVWNSTQQMSGKSPRIGTLTFWIKSTKTGFRFGKVLDTFNVDLSLVVMLSDFSHFQQEFWGTLGQITIFSHNKNAQMDRQEVGLVL